MSKKTSIHGGTLLICAASAACLTRPVAMSEPTTKSTFTEARKQQAVDKIDLLLAIDNSASMKDKQAFLAAAVPKLVERLVTPNCVIVSGDGSVTVTGVAVLAASGDGECTLGTPEFKPITDIHVGIVSSSLGNFGATEKADTSCSKANADDHAQLLARGSERFADQDKLEGGNFLAWFPTVESNQGHEQPQRPYADRSNPGELSAAFADLVRGVSDQGCGLEAQLESMYQFLIAPQPWSSIVVNAQGRASYEGINARVLQQRSDFLRPDSLVAVIMLTDEDDSSVDPLSVGGQGHLFMNNNFPQNADVGALTRRGNNTTPAARGTSVCATDPASPECTSCAFGGCAADATYYGDEDQMNVRFFDMKRRFGVDPQYPIARYVRGLTTAAVPSRDAEHGPNYGPYDTQAADCTNPLFAGTKLPTDPNDMQALCTIAGEARRDPSLVFFALVGGVPNDLVTGEARAASGELTTPAWARILGSDPANYKDRAEDGKDVRMVQSISARSERRTSAPDDTPNDTLNQNFRDWNTQGNDLQYACTFPLPTPTLAENSLDCVAGSDAPLCAEGTGARDQIRAKAYPTIREAWLVRDLGSQGVLTSLCPQNSTNQDSPDYGYAPAVNEIVDRLKNAITSACVPRALQREANGKVPCLMLELMPPDSPDCTSEPLQRGRTKPDERIVAQLKKQFDIAADRRVCQLTQDTSADTNEACQQGAGGWCYLEGEAAGRCEQQIVFNDGVLSKAKGSRVYLQCINQYVPGEP